MQALGGPEAVEKLLALPPDVFSKAAAEEAASFVTSMSTKPEAAELKLSPVERFMVEVVAVVPAVRTKLAVLQFLGKPALICHTSMITLLAGIFNEMWEANSQGIASLCATCGELRNSSRLQAFFVTVVLPLGNRLNQGTQKVRLYLHARSNQ